MLDNRYHYRVIDSRGERQMEAGAAAEAGGRTSAGGVRRGPRKILLFSDGTGNSSGKLFKTNVWRLYEAVDLGPGRDGWPAQIALYNNGVGTSTFRPLAALGGIFGFGLKSNVLALYKYICRNWMPGDEIFLFGFSRGAFTVRLLTGLIVSQGILRGAAAGIPPDEDRLAYLARAAYRAFAGEAWPNRWPARMVARIVRCIRDALLELHRRLTRRVHYHAAQNVFTDIAFVGVWDTVAAYGGPIMEITRGIDDWIWPLTMPNYQLSPRVQKARHALALDDERDAFQPLLWDEVREEMLAKWGGPIHANGPDGLQVEIRQVPEGRLKQVWFCGMHADVGGGYSDESLSFVSLAWMIDELDGAVRLLPENEWHIASIANVYGPVHNSRAGLGAYYRFQPRRIAALLDWRDASSEQQVALAKSTRSMRDPAVADRTYRLPRRGDVLPSPEIEALAGHIRRDHGLLTAVRVHESVVDRIHSGTDNYAPIGLPQRFDVVFSKRYGLAPRTLDPVIARNMRNERRHGGGAATWFTRQGRTWDMVGLRRVQYFLTAFLTSLLATMPLWDNFLPAQHDWQVCTDSRCVARPILELLDKVSGGYAGPWVDAFARNFLIMLILLVAIGLMLAWSRAYDLKLRSRARRAWRRALGLEATSVEPERSRGVAAIRDMDWYQGLTVALKWHLAPAAAGLGLIVVAFMATISLLSQLALFPLSERHDVFCKEDAVHAAIGETPIAFPMDIASPCNGAGRSVVAGEVYSIRVTVLPNAVQAIDQPEGWSNARQSGASPAAGRGADLPWWRDLIGAPFKRVMLADWLAPLVAVQPPPGNDDLGQRLFGRPVEINRPKFVCDPKSGGYVTLFQPEMTGTLRMFVNDALLPWRPSHFYTNNVGRAVVQVWTGADGPDPVPGALACSVAAM
jgi:uncharacterized protein (DUF2235 family)